MHQGELAIGQSPDQRYTLQDAKPRFNQTQLQFISVQFLTDFQ